MKIWRWARGVAADRGEPDALPIHIERTGDGHGYALRLGVGAGFGGHQTARVPVRLRINPAPHPVLKEVHAAEVAGRTVEAANVYALREKARALLESIAPAGRLPVCWFRSPAMDYELPVYERGGELTCPVVGGPRLRAHDLATIRRDICRYLVSAGYVHDADEVEVGVLRPRDLRRVAPAAVFRSQADPAVWIPSVEGFSPDGPVVGVLGTSPRLAGGRRRALPGPAAPAPAPSAPDVVALLRSTRADLERGAGEAAAEAASALYATQVRPEIWAAAEERTHDAGVRLVARLSDADAATLEVAVRTTGAGDACLALEDRGITVFLDHDAEALAGRLGAFLEGSGFMRFAAEVEIHDARARRAERLDADSIWTFGEREPDALDLAARRADGAAEAGYGAGTQPNTAGGAGIDEEVSRAWSWR